MGSSQPHTFRRLNPLFLSWLQLAEFIWGGTIQPDSYESDLRKLLEAPTPSLEEINVCPDKYFRLNFPFSLEEDFGEMKSSES